MGQVCLDDLCCSSECVYSVNKDEGDESLFILAFRRELMNAIFLKYSKEGRSSSSHVRCRNITSDACYSNTKQMKWNKTLEHIVLSIVYNLYYLKTSNLRWKDISTVGKNSCDSLDWMFFTFHCNKFSLSCQWTSIIYAFLYFGKISRYVPFEITDLLFPNSWKLVKAFSRVSWKDSWFRKQKRRKHDWKWIEN